MVKLNNLPGYYFIKQKIKNKISFDLKSNILLFSDPRGGSTWFSECLVSATNLPLIWEPLHIKKVEELNKLNFGWRQFIDQHNKDEEVKGFFIKLFEGQIKSDWIYQFSSLRSLFFAKSGIFKICRGNQLIPYLVSNFQFQNKPIYFVRHPFAVVASQLKQGGWSTTSERFSLEEISKDALKVVHKDFLLSLKTKEEVLTANWALTNKIPLEHPSNNKSWITITYEEFIEDPASTFARIENVWGRKLNINKINFNKVSFTTLDKVKFNTDDQISKWKTQLTEEQIENMAKVLSYFQIKLYTSDPYPTIRYNT